VNVHFWPEADLRIRAVTGQPNCRYAAKLIDAVYLLLLACVLIINDKMHNRFSVNRSVEFFKQSVMSYILIMEFLCVMAAVWAVFDDVNCLEEVLLILGLQL